MADYLSPFSASASHIRRPIGDVYIGGGSKWGDPFRIGPDGDRHRKI
jgi:hypothetical protein